MVRNGLTPGVTRDQKAVGRGGEAFRLDLIADDVGLHAYGALDLDLVGGIVLVPHVGFIAGRQNGLLYLGDIGHVQLGAVDADVFLDQDLILEEHLQLFAYQLVVQTHFGSLFMASEGARGPGNS